MTLAVVVADLQRALADAQTAGASLVVTDLQKALADAQALMPTPINVALASNGGVASASSTYTTTGYDFGVAGIINNDRTGATWGHGGGWGDATQHVYPDWAEIAFNGQKTIDRIVVYTLQDGAPVEPTDTMTFTASGIVDFTVQGWNGLAWVVLGTVVGNNLVKRTLSFAPFSTSKIRINITKTAETGQWGGLSRIVEVEAWGYAVTVVAPAPSITNFAADKTSLPVGGGPVTLSWTVLNATSVKLDGVPAISPVTVQVTQPHAFSLVGASATQPPAQATVNVDVATVAVPGSIVTKPMVRPNVLYVQGYSDGGRYVRQQWFVEAVGNSTTVRIFTEQVVRSDGTVGPLVFPVGFTATLTFDGKPVATKAAVAGDTQIQFPVDLTPIAEGWYLLSVTGGPPGWTAADYQLYVRKGQTAVMPPTMTVVEASYTQADNALGTLHTARVPAVWQPVEQPLTPRAFPPFTSILGAYELVFTQLSVYRPTDIYRPQKTQSGVLTTTNDQDYMYADFSAQFPPWPLLDGPRGRACVTCPTSIRHGRNAKTYFTDPWRFAVVGADGMVKTLAGYRDREPPAYWGTRTLADFDLVGDWSAIPVNRRGFHEVWDFCWDPNSLALDMSAAPIGGEQPHIAGGPIAFIADTKNNRICKLQFSPTDRSVPPKVTEAIVGLNGPWGCEIVGQLLYVSESTGTSVKVYDKNTLGFVRTYTFPGPVYGIRAQDGILYAGSQSHVWKVDLATNAVADYAAIRVNDNSRFINLALSDGTFYPRGTMAVVTWANNSSGFPQLYDTNGKEMTWLVGVPGKPMVGPPGSDIWTPHEHPLSYPSAVAMSDGRLTWGTVQEGLYRLSHAMPTDLPLPPLYSQGALEWRNEGWRLTHGDNGFGFYGLPQPWGVSAAKDAYLTGNKHVRTS